MGHSSMQSDGYTEPAELRLRVLIGPSLDVFALAADRRNHVGRSPTCDVCLPSESVSRRHASILRSAGTWFIVDEGSAAGTYLNGVRLVPQQPIALSHGDLVRVSGWTLRADMSPGGIQASPASAMRTIDDTNNPSIRIERLATRSGGIAAERLQMLTACLEQMQAAKSEPSVVQVVLAHAIKGSGYHRGAVTIQKSDGEIEVVSLAGYDVGEPPVFSRSLISAAIKGGIVSLSAADAEESAFRHAPSLSMAEAHVDRALCAPVMLGDTLCCLIYLDMRAGQGRPLPDAPAFCEALARILGLAMANLKRADLEARQHELTTQLSAARTVQRAIAPQSAAALSPVSYAFHIEPGVFVAGDLFDIVPLADGVAVFLGDVSGHGAGSGMLMALTQAHLNAHLAAIGDIGRAVESLNAYVAEHSSEGRFVTLWIAHIRRDGRTTFIDAGHGHAHVRRSGAHVWEPLPSEGSIPIGIDPEASFPSGALTLGRGDRLVLYSDGVLEQVDPAHQQFGLEGVRVAIGDGGSPADDINRVMNALRSFAFGVFDDDATIASIEYRGE